jgi:hypothetical protein
MMCFFFSFECVRCCLLKVSGGVQLASPDKYYDKLMVNVCKREHDSLDN